MSIVAKVVAALVIVAGATLIVVSYLTPTDDAQDALVIPFLIFWTAIAVGIVWALDRAIRTVWRNFAKPS
jgi:hypothetical protein